MTNTPNTPESASDLPNIGRPARAALATINVHDLAGVARYSCKELLAHHGFSPKAIRLLEAAHPAKGLSFREKDPDR